MPYSPAVAVSTPHHHRNPKTHDRSVLNHIEGARTRIAIAMQREGDRRDVALKSASGLMGLAAYSAECAALLRGHRFTLLRNRDLSIDELCEQSEELHGHGLSHGRHEAPTVHEVAGAVNLADAMEPA